MPGHIKSIDDYHIVEGTDIVYIQESLGSRENIRDSYANTLMKQAGWEVSEYGRSKTSKDIYGWNFYRAPAGGNIWHELDKTDGDPILIGSFEQEKTPPELDLNGNILLKSFGYHLKDEGSNGNVLLSREGRKIVDLKGFGIIHHDVDEYGNYYAEIYKTRSSGGTPVTHKRNYAFFTPEGERIGGKDKSFERSETQSIQTVKSKYAVAGVSPYYIYDMGKNNSGRPEIFPNLAEMLISSMNRPTPFIKTPTQYIPQLFERQTDISKKMLRLNTRLNNSSISQEEYDSIMRPLTDEIEATDIVLRQIEKGIASGIYEDPKFEDNFEM